MPHWLDWQTNSFWALIALLALFGIFLRMKLVSKTTASLDARTKKIEDELSEAKRLREEAQQLLAEYKRRQTEVEQEAQAMIEQAKREAKALKSKAMQELDENLERRKEAAETRIEQASQKMLQEMRAKAADLATEMARSELSTKLDDAKDKKIRAGSLEKFQQSFDAA